MIPYLLAIAGGYLIGQSRKTFAKMEDGGMTDIEIKEGDVFEADYEKEYINIYKVLKIEKDNKDSKVTFENVNPTQKVITQNLSSLNNEIAEGKYELVTKVVKYGYETGNYTPKKNNIVREGNYLKEVVSKQPVYKVTFYDEGRDEWALRDVYDSSLMRETTQTIKEMIESGSLQKPLKKIIYAKGGGVGKYQYKSTEVKSRVNVAGYYIYSDYNDNPYETNKNAVFVAYIPTFAEEGNWPYQAFPTRKQAVENAREYYQSEFESGRFEPTEDYEKRLKNKQNK